MTEKELARRLESAVLWLVKEDCGCVTIDLGGCLAVCVGWSDGFDEHDASVIHASDDKSWAICAAIKVWTSDDMRTDLDWINMPYNEDGDVWDTTLSIAPNENYKSTAHWFLKEYAAMSAYEIADDGRIVGKIEEEAA